jgi:hypothetical protein
MKWNWFLYPWKSSFMIYTLHVDFEFQFINHLCLEDSSILTLCAEFIHLDPCPLLYVALYWYIILKTLNLSSIYKRMENISSLSQHVVVGRPYFLRGRKSQLIDILPFTALGRSARILLTGRPLLISRIGTL